MGIADLISDSLQMKYAIMQQQADAMSKNADTNALQGGASANLDNVRAGLLPKESAAQIAKTGADTNLVNEQTRFYGPEAMARIAQQAAQTHLTQSTDLALQRSDLTDQLTGGRLKFASELAPAPVAPPAWKSLGDPTWGGHVIDFSKAPKFKSLGPDPEGPTKLSTSGTFRRY